MLGLLEVLNWLLALQWTEDQSVPFLLTTMSDFVQKAMLSKI